jgi:hypothetical protein
VEKKHDQEHGNGHGHHRRDSGDNVLPVLNFRIELGVEPLAIDAVADPDPDAVHRDDSNQSTTVAGKRLCVKELAT